MNWSKELEIDKEVEEQIKEHESKAFLYTQQAANFLGMTAHALEKQREAGRTSRIPCSLVGGRYHYYVTELLEYMAKNSGHGLPLCHRSMAILLGEDFCEQIGVQFPTKNTSSVLGTLLFGLGANGQPPRQRGRKSSRADDARRDELESMGVNVTRHRLGAFATLNDFLMHAEPDDEWLFCCPPDRRPYDFIAAIIEGPTEALFVWMSLTEYLDALGKWSATDRDARKSREEGEEIGECLAPPRKPKKVVQRRPKTPDGRL